MNKITIGRRDLDDMLSAIDKMRNQHPDRADRTCKVSMLNDTSVNQSNLGGMVAGLWTIEEHHGIITIWDNRGI